MHSSIIFKGKWRKKVKPTKVIDSSVHRQTPKKGPIFSMEDQEILCWIKFKFHVITNLRNLEKNLHILLYTPSHTHTVTSTSLDRSALVLSVVQMSIYPIVQCQHSENMQMVSTIITIMPWIVSKIITRTVRFVSELITVRLSIDITVKHSFFPVAN